MRHSPLSVESSAELVALTELAESAVVSVLLAEEVVELGSVFSVAGLGGWLVLHKSLNQ
jgi:hypothetical protein